MECVIDGCAKQKQKLDNFFFHDYVGEVSTVGSPPERGVEGDEECDVDSDSPPTPFVHFYWGERD